MVTTPEHTLDAPRRSRHKWTFEQRLCLDVLWTAQSTSLSDEDRALVFNTIFHDDVAAHGNPQGLELGTLQAQYRERVNTGKSSWKTIWGNICATPKVDLALRQKLQDKIDAVLQNGNADTVQVAATAVVTPPTTPRRTDRIRKVTKSPYDIVTPVPKTPVWAQRHLEYVQESPSLNLYATPAPTARKRHAEVTNDQHALVIDDFDKDYVPRAKKIRKSSPAVVVPPSPPQADTLFHNPVTPKPKRPQYRTGGREGANIPYQRFDKSTIMLKKPEYLETLEPLKRISEAAAHPKTTPAILFRYWDDKSHGLNSETGFVCGLFKRAIIEPGPPPSCDVLEWNYIASHLNNGGLEKNGTPSPFISTSNLLIWIVRMAMKRSCETSRISVIDTSKLDPKAVFWVPPFYKELKKKRSFTKGGFNYSGSHEHLVWDRIDASAVIKTFSLKELVGLVSSNNAIRAILRLEAVPTHHTKELKRDNILVNSRVAEAVAEIVMFLGLNHTSSFETLSQAVSEVVQGWALKADGTSQDKVGAFVQVFLRNSGAYIDVEDQVKLEHAFYSGLYWSCGDLNARLKGPAGYEKVKSNAAKRGMKQPAEAIADKLDRARFQAILREKKEERLHMPSSSGVEEEEGEEEMLKDQVGQLMSGMNRLLTNGETIVYE